MGEMSQIILLVHAISGCDTTSALYKKGKVSIYKTLEKNADLRQKLSNIFYNFNSTKQQIEACGEEVLLYLYSSSSSTLDAERYVAYTKKVAKQTPRDKFELGTLPPTSDAGQLHIFT